MTNQNDLKNKFGICPDKIDILCDHSDEELDEHESFVSTFYAITLKAVTILSDSERILEPQMLQNINVIFIIYSNNIPNIFVRISGFIG